VQSSYVNDLVLTGMVFGNATDSGRLQITISTTSPVS